MIVIGEKLNSTRKSIQSAVEAKDHDVVIAEAIRQAEAGSDYLDVNCGTLAAEEEPEVLQWMVEIVQGATGLPLCIDSPNPEALAAGLEVHKGEPLINSISGEKGRFEKVLDLVKRYNARVIALCLDDSGIPPNTDTAIKVGEKLIADLVAEGVEPNRIYLDPLVKTLATDANAVIDSLGIITTLREKFDSLHFVSGLSNVSYGLPERRHLNRAYVVMSIAAGLDAVIMDPLDKEMSALILASEALMGKDRFCMRYIGANNDGRLKV